MVSTNEFRIGRRVQKILWPDDLQIEVGEDDCQSLIMCDTGDAGAWILADYPKGKTLINTAHLEMIEFVVE
jgi:hypothetical protein